MQAHIKARLESLHHELARGQEHLQKLEQEAEQTRQTMLRISGAIQVLEELLQQPQAEQTSASFQNGNPRVDVQKTEIKEE
jgi:hypothetical protein